MMRLGTPVGCVAVLTLLLSAPLVAADIDFSNLPEGSVIGVLMTGSGVSGPLSGTVSVFGFNPIFGVAVNAAIVFDSACLPAGVPADCTGDDADLGTPNVDFAGPGVGVGGEAGAPFENDLPRGNVAIVAENLVDTSPADGQVDNPDDADLSGQFIEFDFTGLDAGVATVNSMTYIDNDEGEFNAEIQFFGPGTLNPSTLGLPAVGDNGVNTVTPGIAGVTLMRVVLNGSGAVASVAIEEPVVERGCWVTTGGFRNSDVSSPRGQKECTFGGNIGPPASGAFEVNWHDGALDGSQFHTNGIVSVACIDMGSTGPGQPGGKKGLEVDTLLFTCTGRFNNVDGYTCEGFLKDSGEPPGKNGNNKDQIRFIVRDPVGDPVASCGPELDPDDPMDGSKLDGGNVQIHPPVGKP